ncbi:MAG: gamma-glutamyltransferase [Myxococcota bacterium]
MVESSRPLLWRSTWCALVGGGALLGVAACAQSAAPRPDRAVPVASVAAPVARAAAPSSVSSRATVLPQNLAASRPQNAAMASGVSLVPPAPAFRGGPHAVESEHGLVVAVEANAAQVGANVLTQGGNAVDAAVATVFALCVTHSSAASLGGGGFALVRARGRATAAFDFRETAPSGLDRREFDQMQAGGGRGKASVGVPGVVAGLTTLAARFGTLPLAELVAPAIELAEKGFALGRWEAELFRMSARRLREDAALERVFFRQGSAPTQGSRVVQRDLAWSLRQIAASGADGFYRGELAVRLTRALAPRGPSLDDLTGYRCLERPPLSISYRGYMLETMPPPSAGGVALVGTLLMLSRSNEAAGSVGSVHYLLEAQRRAQAERRFGVVDPDTLEAGELARRRERWLTPEYWFRVPIGEAATPSLALRSAPGEVEREAEHTTHVSVVDRDGMVVSLTTTLSASFGAKIVAAGTGIVLNNAVASFSSSGDNQPRPGVRTTSSMAPSLLLTNDEVAAVLGTPGGDTIPSTLAQIVAHLVDERMSLEAAIEAPRWHQAFLPDEARYEPALASASWLAELRARGHRLRSARRRFGDANCIVLDGARAFGYADSREPGVAISGSGR